MSSFNSMMKHNRDLGLKDVAKYRFPTPKKDAPSVQKLVILLAPVKIVKNICISRSHQKVFQETALLHPYLNGYSFCRPKPFSVPH